MTVTYDYSVLERQFGRNRTGERVQDRCENSRLGPRGEMHPTGPPRIICIRHR